MHTQSVPLITSNEFREMAAARQEAPTQLECTLDLGVTRTRVDIRETCFGWKGVNYPYPSRVKERTIYYWTGTEFAAASRYGTSLIKLVPTDWGAPTFEIDGIKMLPTSIRSPYVDAERKVALVRPFGKTILDTCGGLGYFAAWCIKGGARQVHSFEKNADVLWLRTLNPWSPPAVGAISLAQADIAIKIAEIPQHSMDAVLHDPPRFGTAGELYSGAFYTQLARVLKQGGKLFHYTGSPNTLTTRRDVPHEIMKRLKVAGFSAKKVGDGILAEKR